MRVLIERRGDTPAPLPEGVTVLERLPSGSVLVDVTQAGRKSLRASKAWSVIDEGSVSVEPRGVQSGLQIDVFAALAAAKARGAKF